MKLLYYGESPLNPTGFGLVNKHILAALSQAADVTHVATTHYVADYNHQEYPYKIVGISPDTPIHERTRENQMNLPKIYEHLNGLDWDVFFYQGDMGWSDNLLLRVRQLLEEHKEKDAIFYMPVDGDLSFKQAFFPLSWCSAPVVYTNHAKSVVDRYCPEVGKHVSVIWLGTEPETFYPLPAEEKRQARLKYFGEEYLERFVCVNVNRNQPRKDLARCMAVFHKFHEGYPDSSLYMHAVMNDAGGSLPSQAMTVGMDVDKRPSEVIFSSLDLAYPWTRQQLNEVYNACDCLVSCSHGEGWGLSTVEAMCAGLPVIVPANTANLDILGEKEDPFLDFIHERGYGIKSGGDLDHTIFGYMEGATAASIIHSNSFLECLEYVYHHRDEAKEKAEKAREWCFENSWSEREKSWIQLLRLIEERQKSASLSIST